jgi:micrococcal nuclease
LFWLGALSGAGIGAYKVWLRKQSSPIESPQWPPLPIDEPATAATPVAPLAAEAGALWVAPVGGTCPDGYPIKANNNSGIFHVPGGRFYDRTVAERCYANADDAVADGYRPAKA